MSLKDIKQEQSLKDIKQEKDAVGLVFYRNLADSIMRNVFEMGKTDSGAVC